MKLFDGAIVTLRNGTTHGPIKASPMWGGIFFSPVGYHWESDGTILGFEPGGNLDVVICSGSDMASDQHPLEQWKADIQQISTTQNLSFAQQKADQILKEIENG